MVWISASVSKCLSGHQEVSGIQPRGNRSKSEASTEKLASRGRFRAVLVRQPKGETRISTAKLGASFFVRIRRPRASALASTLTCLRGRTQFRNSQARTHVVVHINLVTHANIIFVSEVGKKKQEGARHRGAENKTEGN